MLQKRIGRPNRGFGFDSRRERPIPQTGESSPAPDDNKKKSPTAVNEKAAASAPGAAA